MKIVVETEEEAVNLARELTVLNSTIRLSNIDYIKQASAETLLCGLRDAIVVEGGA
jgi:hypothetical protein